MKMYGFMVVHHSLLCSSILKQVQCRFSVKVFYHSAIWSILPEWPNSSMEWPFFLLPHSAKLHAGCQVGKCQHHFNCMWIPSSDIETVLYNYPHSCSIEVWQSCIQRELKVLEMRPSVSKSCKTIAGRHAARQNTKQYQGKKWTVDLTYEMGHL